MDRHKAKFNLFVEKQVKILQKKILDLSEVVIPQDNFKPFRGKILSATNDMFREIKSEIEVNYCVQYTPKEISEGIYEDVVIVKNPIKLNKEGNK